MLLLLLVGAGFMLLRPPPRPATASTPATDTPSADITSDRPATGASAPSPAPLDSPDASTTTVDLATELTTNLQPGRIAFLTLSIDPTAGTAQLTAARGSAGRAKALPVRPRPGYLRVDAFDASGALTFSASVPDPTNRHLEHPSAEDPHQLTTTVIRDPDAPLHLRLPGESQATRLILYRLSPDAPSATAPWAPFATVTLPRS